MAPEKHWLLQPILEHQVNTIKQSSIHARLKWQDGGTPSSKRTGLCKFSFYLEFIALQCIRVLLFKRVSTSVSHCACVGYEHHYRFSVFGLQFKWKQLISYKYHHTSCKELHVAKRPDLMNSEPDAVSTLGFHWTDHTGTTLANHINQWSSSGDPELSFCIIGTHWKITGTTSTLECHWVDARTQCFPSGNPVVICIIGTHWKTSVGTFETHWLLTTPVALRTLGAKFQAHWIAIG